MLMFSDCSPVGGSHLELRLLATPKRSQSQSQVYEMQCLSMAKGWIQSPRFEWLYRVRCIICIKCIIYATSAHLSRLSCCLVTLVLVNWHEKREEIYWQTDQLSIPTKHQKHHCIPTTYLQACDCNKGRHSSSAKLGLIWPKVIQVILSRSHAFQKKCANV